MSVVRLILIAAIAFSALGQAVQYEALQHALDLSREQIAQLQQWRPPAIPVPAPQPGPTPASRRSMHSEHEIQTEENPGYQILNESQRPKLDVIEQVLHRWKLAELTLSSGLVSESEWPGYISICTYVTPIGANASELALSDSQVQ